METRFHEPRHPIGVAAERSGVSTDLIRAWERRYGATEPARDHAGERLYSDAEVERLRLLRLATEGGRRIRRVAGLSLAELTELVAGDDAARAEDPASASATSVPHARVADLEALAVALAGDALETALRALLLELGFVRFTEEVAVPLLRRLGDGWHAGRITPAQEHLASAGLRRVLEEVRDPRDAAAERPAVVVGTLAGERHEMGALAAAVAAGLAGWRVVYLGADLPVEELAAAVRAAGAQAVCISATAARGNGAMVEELRALQAALPAQVQVYAGGLGLAAERHVLARYGVRCPEDLTELGQALRRQAGGGAVRRLHS